MSKGLTAVLTALLVIAGLLGGCGAGSDDSRGSTDEAGGSMEQSGGTPALTKAEFLEQGDEICSKSVEETEAAVRDFLKKRGVGAIQQLSDSQGEELSSEIALPRLRATIEELGELGLPKGEEHQAEEVIAGFEEGVAALEADPSEASRFEYVNKRAQAFGFKVCGDR